MGQGTPCRQACKIRKFAHDMVHLSTPQTLADDSFCSQ